MNDIRLRLEEIARGIFHDDSLVLGDSTKAADVPGWDSLAHVNFMFSVESEFGVEFTDDEFVGFETIGDLSHMLSAKLSTG
jgi:acyl carrier protein